MDKLVFDTYKEAEEYLNTNFKGHGRILDMDGTVLRSCRCNHKNNMVIVYCKQKNPLSDILDEPVMFKYLKNSD